MIAVIFEVLPRDGQRGAYLGAAASLRHHLLAEAAETSARDVLAF